MKLNIDHHQRKWVTWLLPVCLFILLPLTVRSQGIPYIRNFTATEYHAHNQNFDIITGDDGTVYVANFEGLLYFNNTQWNIIHTPGVTRITAVFRDSQNTIWTGGYNYIGYVKHDKRGVLQLQHLDEKHVFQGEVQWIWEDNGKIFFKVSDDKIYTIFKDNVQWAAGAKVPVSGFSVFNQSAHINQIQELEDGFKALATNGNGLIIVDANNKEVFRITENNGLCSNNISHITYNRHGIIWGATDNGVFAIGFPSIYTHFTKNEGLRGEVLAMAQMGNHIYAGTLSGLYVQHGMTFEQTQITHACWQLVRQGSSLLAATANGVYDISSEGSIKQLTTANTLSLMLDEHGFYSGEMDGVYYNTAAGRKKVSDIEKVVKILSDKTGSIWIQNLYGKIWKAFEPYRPNRNADENAMGTLVKYQKEVLPLYTNTVEPFPYPMYYYEDSESVLWLTNNKGRQVYAYQNGTKNQELSALVYPLMDYSVRTMLLDGPNLLLGGDKGIIVVNKLHSESSKALKKPRLLIRNVTLRGDSILYGGYGEQIKTLPTLSSYDSHLTFYYSIDYPSLLLKTQYRTRIDENKWSAWDFDSSEEYANLSYGNHKFEVQARDAFGQISDTCSVSFYIEAPIYLRWYMIVLYILIGILLIQQFMRWRMKRLEIEKHRLESIVKKRTAEVVKQKDEIEEKSKNLESALHELSETQHELVRQEKMATVGKLTQGLIDRILNPLNYINNFAKLSEGLVKDVTANIEDEKEHMDPENYDDTMDVLDMLKGNLQKVGEHGANTSKTLKAMEEMLKDRSGGIMKMNLTQLLHQNEEMVEKYYNKEIAEYHINTVFEIPTDDVFINGNAEQLSKSFMSMLGNAIYAVIKKSKRHEVDQYKPEIRLTAVVKDKQVELKFYDNGIGIEHTILDKIFDPFFTTKTTGEASGIGLYLSREIVQNYGGDINVQSEKHVYTEFTITLPTTE